MCPAIVSEGVTGRAGQLKPNPGGGGGGGDSAYEGGTDARRKF